LPTVLPDELELLEVVLLTVPPEELALLEVVLPTVLPDELELLEVVLLTVPPEELELLEAAAGGVLVGGMTVIEKPGSTVELLPSLAAIMIFEYLPASEILGIPESRPVCAPKLAQAGLFWMLNDSGLPERLTKLGRKL